MAEYKKEKVNDIFRKINGLNEMSSESKKDDEKLTKHIITKITQTRKGYITEDITDRKDFITFAKEAIGLNKYEVKFKKLDERAVIPTYAHDGDVGMDLTAIDVSYDTKGDFYIYHTGLAFETDKHYGIFIFPRSSNRKTEAYMCNHVGIADSATYRGEIMVCFKNRTSLRQIALENRMIAFFNAIEDGKSVEEATRESVKGWMDAFKDPMLFAPYKVGDKVAQMVTLPYPDIRLTERKELSETDRGTGGFGSTDIKK